MQLTRRELTAYAILALPLAFAGLPLYLHAPKFYTDTTGLGIAALGLMLLLVRAFDAVQDPIIGSLCDRYCHRPHQRVRVIAISALALSVVFYALFHPPDGTPTATSWYFALILLLSTFLFSIIMVNYASLGAELSQDYHERTRVTSWRESFTLLGVVLAAAIPTILEQRYGMELAFHYFTTGFAILFIAIGFSFWRATPVPEQVSAPPTHDKWYMFYAPLLNPLARRFYGIFLLNCLAASLPATLVLFFIDDRLDANAYAGAFLAAYFLSGAMGMPLWQYCSRRFGKRQSWQFSMILSIIGFIWAFMLGSGDITAYLIVCIVTGLCLGADLALPPSILADLIDKHKGTGIATGRYFGVMGLLGKSALALAAGLGLPALAIFGYNPALPEQTHQSLLALSTAYALLPCLLKTATVLWLWRIDLEDGS